MIISEPGIYSMAANDYHADPCLEPSLSSHVAHILLTRSPRHAWHAHPRLNQNYQPKESSTFDYGSAAHALLLEGEDRMVVVDAEDWRTNAAKSERAMARAAGLHPVLKHQHAKIVAMRDVAVAAINACPDLGGRTLADGKPEQTVIWRERSGVRCRGRIDWLSDDKRVHLDLKTTEGSANPNSWLRTMMTNGGDLQDVFYRRGIAATGGGDSVGVFLVQEQDEPYACSFVSLSPAFLALGEAKFERAVTEWQRCLAANNWPGYPSGICYVEPPVWAMSQWDESEQVRGHEYDPAVLYRGAKGGFDAEKESAA